VCRSVAWVSWGKPVFLLTASSQLAESLARGRGANSSPLNEHTANGGQVERGMETAKFGHEAGFCAFSPVQTFLIKHLTVRSCSFIFSRMENDIENERPDPELVARAAAETAAPRVLEDYIEAIRILRDKQFTFREIAEWLEQRFNIQADHNSVWRAYTKTMDDYSAHLVAEGDEELERYEAMAEAERNGTMRTITLTPVPTAEVATEAQATVKVSKAASSRAKKKNKK